MIKPELIFQGGSGNYLKEIEWIGKKPFQNHTGKFHYLPIMLKMLHQYVCEPQRVITDDFKNKMGFYRAFLKLQQPFPGLFFLSFSGQGTGQDLSNSLLFKADCL